MEKLSYERILIFLLSILISFSNISSQETVNITGTITDNLGKPMVDVSVRLLNIPILSTVTDTNGTFILEQNPTQLISNNYPKTEPIVSFTNNGLIYNQKTVGPVKISIYNLKGANVSSLHNGKLNVGKHFFNNPSQLAPALYIIGITQNNSTHFFKYHILKKNKQISINYKKNQIISGSNSRYTSALDTLVFEKMDFEIKKMPIDSYITTVSTQLFPIPVMIPSYQPEFWNDNSTTKKKNNCYNYANNKKTNTFAQPGRGSGQKYTKMTCDNVGAASLRDSLEVCDSITQPLPPGKARVALAIAPGKDYHWYREDIDKMWSHKPGKGRATNLDNSKELISNPEEADRGRYKDFCGYYFVDSDSAQGEGHENIRRNNKTIKPIEQFSEASASKVKITIMVFSGREDPYFFIDDNEIHFKLNSLLKQAKKLDNYTDATVEPSRLGYRGILIQNLNKNPQEYMIYNNYLEKLHENNRNQKFMYDSTASIENMLLEEALIQKVIDDDLKEMILEDKYF